MAQSLRSDGMVYVVSAGDGSARPALPDSAMIVVTATSDLEDERGVDRRQIRDLLALTLAQRVDRLVNTVAVWSEILASAGGPSPSQ